MNAETLSVVEQMADVALADDISVIWPAGRLVVVPDLFMLEAEANGEPSESTFTIERSDGRSVLVFRILQRDVAGLVASGNLVVLLEVKQ